MRTLGDLLHFATGGGVTIARGARPEFLVALERVLVSRSQLMSHVRALRSRPGWSPRSRDILPPTADILAHGLEPLDDAQLVALALAPEALRVIQRVIHRELPPRWLPAMDRDGRLLLAEHGRTPPDAADRGGRRPEPH
jgi:hypothetical protein